MLQQLRAQWRVWRERSRAYKIERAVYKKEHAHEAEADRIANIPKNPDPPVIGGGF